MENVMLSLMIILIRLMILDQHQSKLILVRQILSLTLVSLYQMLKCP